jgi:hypothetical protein
MGKRKKNTAFGENFEDDWSNWGEDEWGDSKSRDHRKRDKKSKMTQVRRSRLKNKQAWMDEE